MSAHVLPATGRTIGVSLLVEPRGFKPFERADGVNSKAQVMAFYLGLNYEMEQFKLLGSHEGG